MEYTPEARRNQKHRREQDMGVNFRIRNNNVKESTCKVTG
mgnify:CR=1 FL=1